MSTLRVNTLQNTSTTDGGISIDASGHVTVDSVAMPSSGPLSNRNKIINGDMRIDQRNAGASVANISGYGVDRWTTNYLGSGTGRFSGQQSTTAPTGFRNSWLVTITTADAAPSTNFGYGTIQYVEGFNCSDLMWGSANASPVTLSFWVRSSVTGNFPLVLMNGNSTRSYGTTYTINAANTFEYKTITILGDTTGTWATDNTAGISVIFGFGGGSGRTVSAGWGAGAAATATNVTGATQLIATNGATFYITGVQLEVGSVATPFEHRSYGQELSLCERYYQLARSGVGAGNTSTGVGMNAVLRTTMRAAPSQALTGAIEVSDGVNDQTQSSASITGLVGTVNAVIFILGNFTGITLNRPYFMRLSANTNAIALSAEL